MRRLIPLFLLCQALFAPVALALDGIGKSELRNTAYLDEMDRFLPLKTDRSIVFIGDTIMPARWDYLFRKAARGEPPAVRLDTGAARPLEDCRIQGYVEPPCLEALARAGGQARTMLIIRDFRRDTTMSSGWVMEPGMMMANGKMGPRRQVYKPPTPLYHRSAEVILIDMASRKLHFHGRLVDNGETWAHAETNLGKEIVKRMEKAFRPGVGTDYPRRVAAVNPFAVAIVPGSFLMFQASYERLIGTGKDSFVWDPVYFMYENEDRGLAYLFLPIVGYRRYFRTEGRGAFIAFKGGYMYQEDLGGISGMAISADDLMKTHFLALMLGPGMSIPIKRVRLQAGLAIGLGLGFVQTWTADYFGEPENRSGYGFRVAPVVNANLGIGWAF